jgi:hypothetical protein
LCSRAGPKTEDICQGSEFVRLGDSGGNSGAKTSKSKESVNSALIVKPHPEILLSSQTKTLQNTPDTCQSKDRLQTVVVVNPPRPNFQGISQSRSNETAPTEAEGRENGESLNGAKIIQHNTQDNFEVLSDAKIITNSAQDNVEVLSDTKITTESAQGNLEILNGLDSVISQDDLVAISDLDIDTVLDDVAATVPADSASCGINGAL